MDARLARGAMWSLAGLIAAFFIALATGALPQSALRIFAIVVAVMYVVLLPSLLRNPATVPVWARIATVVAGGLAVVPMILPGRVDWLLKLVPVAIAISIYGRFARKRSAAA